MSPAAAPANPRASSSSGGGKAHVWVVDDDRSVRFVLATALRDAGYAVSEFEHAAAVLVALADASAASAPPDLLFTDVRMPGEDGLTLLEQLKALRPGLPVVVMSAYTDVASTAGAFRGGAHEFLSKPFDLDDAVALVARTLGPREALPPATHVGTDDDPLLVGRAPAMRELFRAIGRLAQAPLSVLVTGETGTGKELVARALHRESPRAARPFVALNTAAIPAELLESELFGHEAGAFTGATRRQPGRFEQADGGTLFLDEIGDMPLPLQAGLLRVLAGGEFFRVGGRELLRVDVRVIAATHQDLEAKVRGGSFRADLLHRLDVVRLRLPPLRERVDDVPQLAERFLAVAAQKFAAPPKRLTAPAFARLRQYAWPGNVRELENVCWRLAALAPTDTLGAAEVEQALGPGAAAAMSTPAPASGPGPAAHASAGAAGEARVTGVAGWTTALGEWAHAELDRGSGAIHARAVAALEQILFEVALDATGGHRGEAAARLGVGRNTLARKFKPQPARGSGPDSAAAAADRDG